MRGHHTHVLDRGIRDRAVQLLEHKISPLSDDPVRGMEEATVYRMHRAHGREGKMAPHTLRLHGLRSPCQAYGRKALRLVEVWPGPGQRMVAEVLLVANHVSIHALRAHRD